MITDLVQIRRLGEQKREENEKLRKHMKRHAFVERALRKIAVDIEESINCQECANCCRVATTKINERDALKLAKFLRIKPTQFVKDYCQESEEEGWVLKRSKETGCVFLDGKSCSVYEARPGTCQDFPHTVHGAGSLLSRMWEMPDRATYCPIVYNTLEAFKPEVKFR